MTYFEKSYIEIFNDMLNAAFEEKLISHDEEFLNYVANRKDISNFYVMILSIHSEAMAEVYKEITKVYKSSKVDFAMGSDLDDLGVIVNCPRPSPTHAYAELTFTKRTDSFIEHPAGIVVSNKRGISYTTLEPLNFTSENNTCTVSAIANIAGVAGRVSENQLTKLESSSYSLTVTNPNPSTGGSDGYDDEQYRELLKNWVKSNQKGNLWAYKDYFSRLDGLKDYHLIPNWDGAGTCKVVLDPSTDYFMNKVYNELQDTVTQLTEDITVMSPINNPIDVYVSCNVDIDSLNPFSSSEKKAIQAKVEKYIGKFFENIGIGEDYIPHKLGVYLDNNIHELKNITFNDDSVITVQDDEKAILNDVQIDME